MRTFVSIKLSSAAVEPLVKAQNQLERAAPEVYSWSNLESIHLTLYFLGDIEDSQVPSLQQQLSLLEQPSFELGWGRLVILPSRDVPKILAAGVIGNVAALKVLQRKIHDIAFPVATNKETRAYFPHATFGRLKRGVPPSAKIVKRALTSFTLQNGPLEQVSSFELMMSTLGSTGAVHTTLQSFQLVDGE